MPIKVLAFDGDDTLWHNESRFSVTQGELRELLRRHVPDADVDRHLFEVEMRNLSLYGYGIKAFTLSMIETAIQLTDGRIPASDLQVILGWGKRMLTAPTELLDGVEAALRSAGERYSLLLITKGDLFKGVEILSDKTAESYRAVLGRRDIKPDEFVMVGNSLRSDVVPVVAVGGRAVHIPYEVTWHHEHVPDDSLPSDGWYRLDTIAGLSRLLGSIDGD